MRKNLRVIIFFLFILTSFLLISFLIPGNEIEFSSSLNRIPISAGITPHHLIAKDLIENFFSYISSQGKPGTIVLLAPDHFQAGNILGNNFITVLPETQKFRGIKVDSSLIKNLSLKNNLIFSNSSISLDHGVTDLMPFVKKYFPDSKIAPFIIPFDVSLEKTDQFAISLNSLAPLKTIVIGSVDFSHYLPASVAKFHDMKSIRTLINFQKEDFKNLEVDSWQALYISRAFALLRNKEFPKIIGYSNSVDFLGDKNMEETTSYFSVVFEEGDLEETKEIEELNGRTILFTGDIMLNREVEYLMDKNSIYYPFKKINQFLRGIDVVVGNLEGPILKNPPNFPVKSLKFAFSPNVVEALSFANFNLLSLANNHTFDAGKIGFKETKEFLKKANINFIGHPISCQEDSLFEKDDITFLAFNKTFPFNCSDDEIAKIVKEIRDKNSDKFLIVIFHWGQEYQLKSSISQQRLAHKIIDAGADLIVGSHPHVVQEIEEYKGKLIFYSLGNFVFDQYFSKDVQQGLALGLKIYPVRSCISNGVYPKRVIYRLFPIQSQKSQPFLMKQKEANEFLEKLAEKSDRRLINQIKIGKIEEFLEDFPQLKEKEAEKKLPPNNLSQVSKVDFGPFPKLKGQIVSHLFNIDHVPSPKGAAFSPDGKEIWIASLLNKKRGVSVFNSENGKEIASINLNDGGGVEIIISGDGKKAYVSQMETAKVYEIDTELKKVLRSFDTKSSWTKVLELSSDEKTLYASNWVGDNVAEIDLTTGEAQRLIPTVNTPRGIYLKKDDNNENLYVAGFGKGEIQKINLKTLENKIIFKSGGAMRHIVADEEKEVLYFSDMAKNTIWKVSLKTDEVEKFADTNNNPNTIALSPDKKILFVSCRGANYSPENYFIPGPEWGSILLFDTETGNLLDAIVAGNQPTALAISPDGQRIVFSDFLDNRLEVFEIPPYEVLKQGKGGSSEFYKRELKK